MDAASCPWVLPGDAIVVSARSGNMPWLYYKNTVENRLEGVGNVKQGSYALVVSISEHPWLFFVMCDGLLGLIRVQDVGHFERNGQRVTV